MTTMTDIDKQIAALTALKAQSAAMAVKVPMGVSGKVTTAKPKKERIPLTPAEELIATKCASSAKLQSALIEALTAYKALSVAEQTAKGGKLYNGVHCGIAPKGADCNFGSIIDGLIAAASKEVQRAEVRYRVIDLLGKQGVIASIPAKGGSILYLPVDAPQRKTADKSDRAAAGLAMLASLGIKF